MRWHCWLLCVLCLAMASWASAQDIVVDERPKLYPETPLTQAQRDQRAALYQFVYGLVCEKQDRLLEALKAFEESARLDPAPAAVHKAQVPLLLLLERPRDALAAAKRVLERDDQDHEAWFLAARLHRGLGEVKDYRNALEKGLAVPGLVDKHPALAQQLYLDLATHLEATEAYAEAIAALGKAAKILDHPDHILEHGPFQRESIVAKAAETYEKIGHLHRRLNQFDEALKAYRTALERQPDSGRMHLHLARIYSEQKKLPEAVASIDAYLRLQPQGTEAYQLKMDLLKRQGKQRDILPWLDQASRNDPVNVALKLLLARTYFDSRQFTQAERVYLALADDSPSEDVYKGLFRMMRDAPGVSGLRMLGMLDKAMTTATKKPPQPGAGRAGEQARAMLNVLREDGELARQLLDAAFNVNFAERDLNYETRYFLAVLADKHGKLPQAELFFREALDDPRQINEAPLYSGLIRILWKSKKHGEVIKVCEKGLEKSQFTNHLLFHNELAKAHARAGNFKDAEAHAEKSVQKANDRDRLFALHLQVRIWIQAHKFAEAESLARKMLSEFTAPGDVTEVRYLMSNLYSAWKKLGQSEEQLLEVLKIDPDNATANNDLGYIWADQSKNLKEAEELIRKALDLDRRHRKIGSDDDKDNAAYVDSLGWVLFRRGDLEGAMKELERAVALPDGDDPTLWDHLADVYYRLENYAKAQSAWERSVQLFEEEPARRRHDERFEDVRRKLKIVRDQLKVN